jgi:hypothetical protein
MEPFLFMALDHLMEIFGWGSLTSPWLDDCACLLGGLLICAFLVDHPLVAYLMVSWSILSHFDVVWYTCLSWMYYILFMDDGSSPQRG